MDFPRLHPDTIEEVKQRVDIVDVIADYVVLKKRGKDFQGLCPFHDEKSPSFTVSAIKQMYYCFGCGTGGNAIKFLMEIGKRPFAEVVLDLARRYQVPIKTLEPTEKKELQRQLSLREQLYEVLALTATFYHHALYQAQGQKALNYLHHTRRFAEDVIQRFQLGYAPEGWETLYHYLVEQKRYPVALIEEAGLIKPRKNGSGYYDQFRDRLMIPIADGQGRIIGFGGRSLGNEDPKYLNSPETPLFDKGKTLFGLDKAKQAIQKQDKAIIVEGYFDVIALQSVGMTNTVASLGTALSKYQVKLLLRYTDSKQIIFNFDADRAGVNATQRAIAEIEPLVYSGQVNLRVLNLPEGKDADEFLKASSDGVEKYQSLVENAPLWIDWQIQQLLIKKNLKQADQFEQVVRGMLKILNQLEEATKKTYYVQYCAEILSQGDTRLIPIQATNLLFQLKQSASFVQKSHSGTVLALSNSQSGEENESLKQVECSLLRIYLHRPESRLLITEQLEAKDLIFSFSHHRLLWKHILTTQESFDAIADPENKLISKLQDIYLLLPEQSSQVELIFYPSETNRQDIENYQSVLPDAIARLEKINWEKYSRYCQEQFKNSESMQEPEQVKYYLQEFINAQSKFKPLTVPKSNL